MRTTDKYTRTPLVRVLLKWYRKNARDLPWRRTSDPYAIWISEIMLQQTQVKTVIPYWERWMNALPDVASLASANPDRVLKLWEGLGYYTRARNLQKAARLIVGEHNGKFPREFDAILQLPGIGRYTGGAISSIAFNEAKAILDGNVIRVLARLHGIRADVKDMTTNRRLWDLAQALVEEAARVGRKGQRNCSDFNQGLMEFGAVVCTPKQPQCELCPLAEQCVAFDKGWVERLPNLGARLGSVKRQFVCLVIRWRGRYFVRQRPKGGVNSGLWEFPNCEVTGNERVGFDWIKSEFGLSQSALEPLTVVKHSITQNRITLQAFAADLTARLQPRTVRGKWLGAARLEGLAFTSAHGKVRSEVLIRALEP